MSKKKLESFICWYCEIKNPPHGVIINKSPICGNCLISLTLKFIERIKPSAFKVKKEDIKNQIFKGDC